MTDQNDQVFLDIMLGNEEIGRMTIELFTNIVPKTAANFKSFCLNLDGKSYKNSKFHRIIKDFMVQGGDYENNDGTGGTSIYPDHDGYFKDENFQLLHDQAMLLSMANIGPNTNGSQFFITSKATPHLDKKHVVFGRIIKGQEVFRRMENVRCDENDVPLKDVIIYHCGEVQLEPAKMKIKKIEEKVEEAVESEEESSGEDSNPYVIGVKPPPEFESSQSFLDRAGKSKFRVQNRPKDSKDASGRNIRGRGLMKFASNENSSVQYKKYNQNDRFDRSRGAVSKHRRDHDSDLRRGRTRTKVEDGDTICRQEDVSRSKPKNLDLRLLISKVNGAIDADNLQKNENGQILSKNEERKTNVSRSRSPAKNLRRTKSLYRSRSSNRKSRSAYKNRARSRSFSCSKSPVRRISRSRSPIRNRARRRSLSRSKSPVWRVSRSRSPNINRARSRSFSRSSTRSGQISRCRSPKKYRTKSTSLSRSRSPVRRTRSPIKRNRARPSPVGKNVSRSRSPIKRNRDRLNSGSPFGTSDFSRSPRRSRSKSDSGRYVRGVKSKRQRRSLSRSRSRSRSPRR